MTKKHLFGCNSLVLAGLMCVALKATGATYYVDPQASAGGSGSAQSPFSNIASCNSILRPGDTCLLKGGTYVNQTIVPARSGAPGAPITYAAASGETPKLTKITRQGGTAIFLNEGQDWITIKGITVDGEYALTALGVPHPGAVNGWVKVGDDETMVGSQNIVFEHNRFYRGSANRNYDCFDIAGPSSDIQVRHNVFEECGTDQNGDNKAKGNNVHFGPHTQRILFERNQVNRGGHDSMNIRGRYHVIQNNEVGNTWNAIGNDYGVRIFSFETYFNEENRFVIQNNVFWGVGRNVRLGKLLTTGSIVRGNRFGGYVSSAAEGLTANTCCGYNDNAIYSVGQRIYNNEFENVNGREIMLFKTLNTDNAKVHDNVFKNNAINNLGADQVAALYQIKPEHVLPGQDPFNRNQWINNSFADSTVYVRETENGIGRIDIHSAQNNYPETFANNLMGQFRGENQGADLTRVTRNSSGRQLHVADAAYFTDGNNVIPGDFIRIGSGAPIQVTSVNYQNNILTLSQSVSANVGQPVNLIFSGDEPSTGVYQGASPGISGQSLTVRKPMPPQNITFQ
ncbi:MAG: hypothetical protein AAF541_21250 [Pseudomonadota bacterium]